MVENGYDALGANDSIKASDDWFQFWEAIKYRINPDYKTLGYLEEQYQDAFFIRNVVQDLELVLDDAGSQDSTYYEKRITFCRSFCDYFPDEELIYHNMRRAIADTYSKIGQYYKAEEEFEQFIKDVPDNPCRYVIYR